MQYWLAVGTPEHWSFTFNNENIWGFSDKYRKTWELISIGDELILYAMRPVKGFIGYCTVNSKLIGEQIYFPQELFRNNVMWRLRVILTPQKIIPKKDWASKSIQLENRGFTLRQSLTKLNGILAKDLIKKLDEI